MQGVQGPGSSFSLRESTRRKTKRGEEALKMFQIRRQEETVANTDEGEWETSQNCPKNVITIRATKELVYAFNGK